MRFIFAGFILFSISFCTPTNKRMKGPIDQQAPSLTVLTASMDKLSQEESLNLLQLAKPLVAYDLTANYVIESSKDLSLTGLVLPIKRIDVLDKLGSLKKIEGTKNSYSYNGKPVVFIENFEIDNAKSTFGMQKKVSKDGQITYEVGGEWKKGDFKIWKDGDDYKVTIDGKRFKPNFTKFVNAYPKTLTAFGVAAVLGTSFGLYLNHEKAKENNVPFWEYFASHFKIKKESYGTEVPVPVDLTNLFGVDGLGSTEFDLRFKEKTRIPFISRINDFHAYSLLAVNGENANDLNANLERFLNEADPQPFAEFVYESNQVKNVKTTYGVYFLEYPNIMTLPNNEMYIQGSVAFVSKNDPDLKKTISYLKNFGETVTE